MSNSEARVRSRSLACGSWLWMRWVNDRVSLCWSAEDWWVCYSGKSQIAMDVVESSTIKRIFPSPSRGITPWSVSCFPSDFRPCFFLHHEMGTIVKSSSTLFSLPSWRYCLFLLKPFLSLCVLTLFFFLRILEFQLFLEHLSHNSPYDVFTFVTDQLSLAFLASRINQVWRPKSE
jgi:hypothetical protein